MANKNKPHVISKEKEERDKKKQIIKDLIAECEKDGSLKDIPSLDIVDSKYPLKIKVKHGSSYYTLDKKNRLVKLNLDAESMEDIIFE